ncbi:FtsX-like permease family protein [Granulicoccus phenolivorans]|uniref:FtsX-like permease family protein n=1 Tax=Granulicoccus phenolivorans TaxID=266854 RepID=UPI00041DE1E1|nr:FtsX-like permease family protein [Granulicoccus phenolivorans]
MPGARELRTLTRNALRRSGVSAVILVAFVALAAMLAGAAAALVVSATGATEALMQRARTPHYLQMHTGPVDRDRMAAFAEQNPLVAQWAVVPMLTVDGAAVRISGPGVDTTLADSLQDNSFVTQNAEFDFLLDTDDRVIQPAPGTVWLPLFYREELGLATGNVVTVTGPGATAGTPAQTRLVVAGFLRDSQMNSSYASSKRLLVAPDDLAAVQRTVAETGTIEQLIQFRLTDPAAVGTFEVQYREAGLEAGGPTITWSLFTLVNSLSEGITAAIVILVTVLLVAIALLCVRFTLLTTIEQDQRQIGVLKAVGVRGRDLRRLYTGRYLALAVAGALLGVALAPLLSRSLLARVDLFMGPSGRGGWALLVGWVLAAGIVAVVGLSVRRTLRALDRVSPVEALRSGTAAAGRVRRTPRWLSVSRGRLGANLSLGLADLGRRPGMYAVPLVIFTLASFILIVPQNLYSTVTAPGFITHMGAGVSDLRIDIRQTADPRRAGELDAALAGDPQVARHSLLVTADYAATAADGTDVRLKIESGDLAMFPIRYATGQQPSAPDQLALSTMQAQQLGARVGDPVVVRPPGGGQPLALTVVGIYSDVTNGGRTAKMVAPHTSTQVMWSTLLADVVPGADPAAVVGAYAAANPDLRVSSVDDYVQATMGGTAQVLRDASVISLLVGLAIAALITALFLRLLLTADSARVATLRALGFRDGQIRAQYAIRTVVLLLVGVVLGAVLANTVGGLLAGLLLSGVGLTRLDLIANPLLAWLATPAVLLLTVAVTAYASTRPGADQSITATMKE